MHAPASPPARVPTLGEILLLGSLTAFGAITIDLYLPTLPAIAAHFATTPAMVQLTFSAFFIGMAIGQLFYGPASDRFGRRPAILVGCLVYIAASLACVLAPSIEWLIAGRFLQALGCCAGMVVARAVVRDRYDHRDSARIFSLLTLVLGVAPLFAPTIGGWLALAFSWRSIFVAFVGVGVLLATAVWLRLEESRSPATAAKARSSSALAGYVELLGHRRLVGYVLVSACNGASLFSYIATAPDLLISVWGYSTAAFGVIFAAGGFVIVGASQVNRALLRHHAPDRILAVATLVAVLLGWTLLGLALSGAGAVPIMVAMFAALTSNAFVAANALAGALSVDPLRAGATSGLFGSANFLFGGLASVAAAALHNDTAVPVAAVIAVALTMAALAYYSLARPPRDGGVPA